MNNNHLTTEDFLENKRSKQIINKAYNLNLFKGEHKVHKYIRKEGNRYIYHESYQKTKGGKAFHHSMLEMHHGQKADEAKHSLSNYLDHIKEGKYSGNSLDKLVSDAVEHAKKHAFHKSERMKHISNDFEKSDSETKKDYIDIHNEHEQEGVNEHKYTEAYHEHKAKKEADEKKDKEYTHEITDGSGIDSGKKVKLVSQSSIKTRGDGVPTNVNGAYKPVDWKKEVAIQYEDGSFGTMFKNRLKERSK